MVSNIQDFRNTTEVFASLPCSSLPQESRLPKTVGSGGLLFVQAVLAAREKTAFPPPLPSDTTAPGHRAEVTARPVTEGGHCQLFLGDYYVLDLTK